MILCLPRPTRPDTLFPYTTLVLSRWEIDFVILGPELESLAKYAEQLREKSADIGIIDADTTLRLDKPELLVQIDRDRAAALGVDTEDVASALRIMVGGDERVTRFYDPTVNDSYDVQVRLEEDQRREPEEIARLFVPRQGIGRESCRERVWRSG